LWLSVLYSFNMVCCQIHLRHSKLAGNNPLGCCIPFQNKQLSSMLRFASSR